MEMSCLADQGYRTLNEVVVMGAFVFVAMMFAVSLAGTPLVLWLYRRRVVALMSSGTGGGPAVAPLPARPPVALPPLPAGRLVDEARLREQRLRRVLIVACAVYSAVAGLLLTFSPAVFDGGATGVDASPVRLAATLVLDALMVGAMCMPIVLVGVAHPRFGRLYWRWFAPALALAATLRFGLNATEGDGAASGLAALFVTALFVVLFYVAVARRHVRQVAPLLNVIFGTLFAGLALALWLLLVAEACRGAEAAASGEGTLSDVVMFLASVVCAIGAFWGAARLARWLGARYERKAVSDAQLQTGSWLLMLTAFVALGVLGFDRQEAGPWLLLLLAANVVALAAYADGLRRVPAWTAPHALLLLRVFAHDERGERLLDETAFRWRFVGPIHMIGGPDMALQTLDPHELLLFVRGRARDQFVTSREALAQRLASLDEQPDPDRRYRVNELFCDDRLWQAGVQALLARCAVVLLDLRGFTRLRGGTAYEIGLLAAEGALPRTVCLVDDATDLGTVRQIIASHGGGTLGEAHVLEAGKGLDARALFTALAEAAQRGGAVQAAPADDRVAA